MDQLVRRNIEFDPAHRAGFGSDDYYIWNRIGAETTVRDLIVGSGLSGESAAHVLRRLLGWGALHLEEGDGLELEIDDQMELGALTAEETRLLEEDVNVPLWEKRRIIYVWRIALGGRPLELLGVEANASKRTIKQAYFALSKEFHPDRHYGRRLGSFAALLTTIFEAATRAMQTASQRSIGHSATRRRSAERYPLAVRATVSCDSWQQPQELVTGDVSAGGMYFATLAPTQKGTRVQVSISLPTLGSMSLRGRVASLRTGKDQRHTGVGIELVGIDRPDQRKYDRLLLAARSLAPSPANPWSPPDDDVGPAPKRRRLARGSGSIHQPGPVVGIDLGTTFTSVSAAFGNAVQVLQWPNGSRGIPSVVGITEAGTPIVGTGARKRLVTHPRQTVASAKRLLGRRADERALEGHLAQAAYTHAAGADGSVVVQLHGEMYAVPQLCAYLLHAAKTVAERNLSREVRQAVITVPVTFSKKQLGLLVRAAELAQLEVVGVVDEPSAAAWANRYRPDFGGVVGVYDFGGGTFDFSVVDASAGDFRVLSTAGDSWLGGDDFDLALAETTANEVWKREGIDLRHRLVEWQKLLFACERAKRRLTQYDVASIVVHDVLRGSAAGEDLRVRVSRATAERLWAPAVERSLATVTRALAQLSMAPSELDAIYVSGGTSHIPVVRRALRERFGRPVRVGVPPEHAACLGAGIHAAQLGHRAVATLPSRL